MEQGEQGLTDFGKLTDVSLRTAWPHEAHDFTPWLAENLDRLSEAIGVDLDAETTEAPVGQFAGDILATGPEGQSVLIENQLESSDHSHLGQIMTYLAGLDARIVIWVARDFAEPHLSAIQWLNRHTDDEFAFFAVRLRVVRIADSPLAPIFDIAAKPNRWERQVRHRSAGPRAELVQTYREFWTHYAQRYPKDGIRANHGLANFWGPSAQGRASDFVGILVRERCRRHLLHSERPLRGRDEGVARRAARGHPGGSRP